jgi:tetratricopeptide (TPR) repeat protein
MVPMLKTFYFSVKSSLLLRLIVRYCMALSEKGRLYDCADILVNSLHPNPNLMKTLDLTSLIAVCFIVLSANPLQPSTPEARPIALCGNPSGWSTIISDSVSAPPLFTNLGTFEFRITIKNSQAQTYFNQGMRLYYGFNHREAFKAFRHASSLDPSSAMCWWGQALALGPHINMPMMDSVSSYSAYDAIQRAIVMGTRDARERDLIETQAARYAKEFTADRSSLDNAYVESSRRLAEKYPNDADILTLAAEAIMDVHFWDYWEYDGRAKTWTPEILDRLEKALAINPEHPGANHFYIHAVEASKEPGRALKSADRLQTLMPGAGHMVHMPSHIYIRTGQYKTGRVMNEKAVAADEAYFKTSFEEGLYSLAYHPHNYHFLWACAVFEGSFANAMKAAEAVQSKTNTEWMKTSDYSYLQHWYAVPMYTLVQFGKWEDILQEPLSFADLPYLQGVWQYAQGIAYVRKKEIKKAESLLAGLRTAQQQLHIPESAWINSPKNILAIAEKILEAEIHAGNGNDAEAKKSFEQAMQREDALRYNEPADWHKPVRQVYGAFLIRTGNYTLAEKVYREDLAMYPENGWSLQGLFQSAMGQNKKEAAAIKKRFEQSWTEADTPLTTSAF